MPGAGGLDGSTWILDVVLDPARWHADFHSHPFRGLPFGVDCRHPRWLEGSSKPLPLRFMA